MTAQPLRPWMERIDLRRFAALDVPRSYIRCVRDAALPPVVKIIHTIAGHGPDDRRCSHMTYA